jgi:hypothetical protein
MSKAYIVLSMIGDSESHIIGQIMSENDEEVVLFRPLTIKVHYDTSARKIRTWVRESMNFSADQRINFLKSALCAYTMPSKEVIELYNSYMSEDAQFIFDQVEGNIIQSASIDSSSDETLTADEEVPYGATKH